MADRRYSDKIQIKEGWTDDQIRQEASNGYKYFNGNYSHTICRKCGWYAANLEGDALKAKIVDQCRDCFDKP